MIDSLTGAVTDADTFDLRFVIALFAIVAVGSCIPVLPTGAAVSVAAVLAEQSIPELAVVLAVGAAGAYLGDLLMFAALTVVGEPLAHRIGWLSGERPQERLRRMRDQVERNEVRVLLLSRLVPAGRVPVLLAAALGGYSWRRYAAADVAAASIWAVAYAVIGIAGGSVFPHPWQGIVAAVAVVVLISLIGSWLRRRSEP